VEASTWSALHSTVASSPIYYPFLIRPGPSLKRSISFIISFSRQALRNATKTFARTYQTNSKMTTDFVPNPKMLVSSHGIAKRLPADVSTAPWVTLDSYVQRKQVEEELMVACPSVLLRWMVDVSLCREIEGRS